MEEDYVMVNGRKAVIIICKIGSTKNVLKQQIV